MPATLSLLGLIEYNPLILDSLAAAMPTADIAASVKTGLLAEAAELEVLYPDATAFKQIFDAWVVQRTPIWDKLYNSTQLQYDPLHNYDRTETEHIVHDSTEDADSSSQLDSTRKLAQDVRSTHSNTGSEHSSAARYGYNNQSSATPEATGATDTQGSGSGTELTGQNETQGQTGSATGHIAKAGQESRSVRAYGNIGVTTSDELIAQYRETQKFDFVQLVIDDVVGRFCLLVY